MTNRLELTYAVEWFPYEGEGPVPLLIPDLRVDGRSLLDRFTIDLRELVASTHDSGEFWVFTCACGEPGCTGIEYPVIVSRGIEDVVWEVPWPIRGSRGKTYRDFVFSRVSYFDVIRSALDSAKQMAVALAHKDCIGPYGFEVEDLASLAIGEL